MMTKRLVSLVIALFALCLGTLLTFAFAPYEVFPLAILVPALLLGLILKTNAKGAFKLGFIFGLGFFGAGVYWVYISIHVIGGVPISLATAITALLVAFLALFPAFTCYLCNRYFPQTTSTKLLCAFPAMWVASEWVRSWFLTGFPWLLIGYSQTNSPLRGYAPLLSVYGVSLAVVLSSALLLNSYFQFRRQHYKNLYLNLFGFLCIWIGGALFSLIPWTHAEGPAMPVALVQGNIPQTIKWSAEHLQLSFDRYISLTEPLWQPGQLIIWPEAAIPVPLQNMQDFITKLDETAKTHQTHLILGVPIKAPAQQAYYNAIVVLGSATQAQYLKRHLVPFGEYTPFSEIFANLFQFMNIPMSDMVPGEAQQAPIIIHGVKILPSICYEIAYPELIHTDDRSKSILLTITDDAWFGRSNAEAQHLQMAAMRAIELARPLLFVSNDGITAIISPTGRITAAAPQHVATVLKGHVQPMAGLTPWMRNDMDPILFILIVLLVRAFAPIWQARFKKTTNKNTSKQHKH